LLGIQDDQLRYFGGDEVWELERLYYSPPPTPMAHDSPEADRWLRDRMRAACGTAGAQASRRIYVSRRLTIRRRIVNEAEVAAYLQQHGFEFHELEDLSFREKVALFSEAQIVVGSHGAGFTNILFAPTGLSLIALVEPRFVRFAYWAMCEALGHHFWYCLGETIDNPASSQADISIPVSKLAQTLTEALELTQAN
jgi:capsular polysaccharide biosynthesis protein